jgi:CheY-like chemotaxis protein
MDGYDLAKAVRYQDGLGGVMKAAVTGCDQPEDRECAPRAGFDEHFPEPLDRRQLAERPAKANASS